MDATDQPAEPQPAPRTFSLGTLMLAVATAGVAVAGYRIGCDYGVAGCALIFAGGFLVLWFFLTGRFRAMRYAGALVAAGLFLSSIVAVPVPAHEAARRATCASNLKQIGLALLAYHQAYGSFPPACVTDANGKPLYSWRVLILPQLGQENLARQIRVNEAWDGPHDKAATQAPLLEFICPSDFRLHAPPPPAADRDRTNYVAVVGPNTAWTGAKPRKLSDFRDPSKTILLVEVENSGIHWAEPRDLYIGQMPMAINPPTHNGISSDHPGGVNVVFADGHVEFLPDSTTPAELAAMLDIDGRGTLPGKEDDR